jgi:hypothetical protein
MLSLSSVSLIHWHISSQALHYNFARIHKTLRITPAMAAGISDHVWGYEEIAALIPEPEFKPRGPYKPRISN